MACPVRDTMFHMTNDSHLFKTTAQLEGEGFYPVHGNRWKRGEEMYLPLYEGDGAGTSTIAASVVVNPENLNRPAQPRATLEDTARRPGLVPDDAVLGPGHSLGWLPESSDSLGFQARHLPQQRT